MSNIFIFVKGGISCHGRRYKAGDTFSREEFTDEQFLYLESNKYIEPVKAEEISAKERSLPIFDAQPDAVKEQKGSK